MRAARKSAIAQNATATFGFYNLVFQGQKIAYFAFSMSSNLMSALLNTSTASSIEQ